MLTPVSGGLVVNGLTPVGTTNPIVVNAFQKPDLDLETAMEDAFLNLSDAIGAALQAQLRKEVGGVSVNDRESGPRRPGAPGVV